MKRIGIITLYCGNNNYGGIAQAYALQRYIQDLGYSCELLNYQRSKSGAFDRKRRQRSAGEVLGKCVIRGIEKLAWRSAARHRALRAQAFASSRDRIPHSRLYTEESIPEANQDYDIFISGSDQIWKPYVMQKPYVLSFAQPGKIKLSYGSSIAQKALSAEYDAFMAEHLSDYQTVSVREKEGADHLEQVLKRKVNWVTDPVLLLPADAWKALLPQTRKIREPYLFCYLLGDDAGQRKYAAKIAKENGLKLAVMPHLQRPFQIEDAFWGDIRDYGSTLGGFLDLISNAQAVITDSFHAAVFSYIFRREFIVFDRKSKWSAEDMSGRLTELLDAMGQPNRFYRALPETPIRFAGAAQDYSAGDRQLRERIAQSKTILRESLEMAVSAIQSERQV